MSVEQLTRVAHSVFSERVSQNYLNNLPILNELKEFGCIKGVNYGSQLKKGMYLVANTPTATDADGNSITVQDVETVTSGIFNWKYIPKEIKIGIEELNLKGSENEKIEWLVGKISSGAGSIFNALEKQLASDGSAFSGLAIDGFLAGISTTPEVGTYGQIDRSAEERIRNKAFNALDGSSALPDAGNPTSIDNIKDRFRYIINEMASKKGITHIFCSSDYYSLMDEAVEDKQRIITDGAKWANVGYQFFNYKGVRVINCGGLHRSTDGTLTGFPEKTAIFLRLNPDDVELCFFNKNKYSKELREMLKQEEKGFVEFNMLDMIAPNMENGNFLHKSSGNSTYYSEIRFTGNLMLGDTQNTAILFEAQT